ncbi:MAG: glycine zipper family protein [Muribaculum sp.]|nr:glycine zipper family protein [Muribaculaceae bacterium]MCM1081456.1 glycine zipper family protein [Muribaculum sp.]
MKKNVLIPYFLLILFFSSCSSNEDPKISVIRIEVEKPSFTIQRLKSINDSIQFNNFHSRGRRNNLNNLVFSDAQGALKYGKLGAWIGGISQTPQGVLIGALIGGTIGGAAYSYRAYLETQPENGNILPPTMIEITTAYCSNEVLNNQNFITILDLADNEIEYIGEYHNRTLDYLIRNEGNGVCAPQSDELGYPEDGPIRAEDYVKISIFEESILYSDDYFNEFNSDMENFSLNDNMTYGEYSPCDDIMDTYIEAIGNYGSANEISDVINVTNLYIQVIRESTEITESDKNNLYIAFSVAVYSYKYWTK